MNLDLVIVGLIVNRKRKALKFCASFFPSQETEFKMRKLEMMKQKRLTLDAEVRYNLRSSCKTKTPTFKLACLVHYIDYLTECFDQTI